ncbi:MAG: hypothetical protein IKE22_06245 [Atopobiaceae bacterium]|nr:hypothetical protein [Atopobiaceae bacterium]
MSTRHDEFDDLLRVLDEAGCLSHVLIVGSWAEYLYEAAGAIAGYQCAIRTLDADVLVRNRRRPADALSMPEVAKRHGFLVVRDRITDTTKLVHPMGLEVEFLLGKVGAGLEPSMGTNLGVTAQTLRHLDILSRNPMGVRYQGMDVLVPIPEAYVAQKMVVNHERGSKSDKDAAAIANLWPHLDLNAFEEVRSSLTRRETARLDDYMRRHGSELAT